MRVPRVKTWFVGVVTVATTVLLLPAQESLAQAPPADRQIVMLLDGSGSISGVDWQLQKDGLAAALQDTISFPRDGSVSLGVIQWASGTTQVEIPLTTTTSSTAQTTAPLGLAWRSI